MPKIQKNLYVDLSVAGVKPKNQKKGDVEIKGNNGQKSLPFGYNWPQTAVDKALKYIECILYRRILYIVYGYPKFESPKFPTPYNPLQQRTVAKNKAILRSYIKNNPEWYLSPYYYEDPLKTIHKFEELNLSALIPLNLSSIEDYISVADELQSRFKNMVPLIRNEGKKRLKLLGRPPYLDSDEIKDLISAAEKGETGNYKSIVEVFGFITLAMHRLVFEKRGWSGMEVTGRKLINEYRNLAIFFLQPAGEDELGSKIKDFIKLDNELLFRTYLVPNNRGNKPDLSLCLAAALIPWSPEYRHNYPPPEKAYRGERIVTGWE
ncbi:MAG: hypothetical protein ACFFD4_35855 [Candidatus Odinarchaeota archaeon]